MECFLLLQKPLLVGLCVVMLVLFCGVFLGFAETIVGWPVCCYVGIVQCSFYLFVLRYLMITQSVVITRRKLS